MHQYHQEIAQQMAQSHSADLLDEAARARQLRDTAMPSHRRAAARRLALVMTVAAPVMLLAIWLLVVR